MKVGMILLSFLLVAVLLIGCTQQQQQPAPGPSPTPSNNTPGNNAPAQPGGNTPVTTTPPAPETVGMDQVYILGSVHSFEYNGVLTAAGQEVTMNLKSAITPDTLNGVAVWLEQINITIHGASVNSKMWVDKVTYKCLNLTSIINYKGQTFEQQGQCPTEGPYSVSRTGTTTPTMTFLGSESVTVPAGTYTANEYSLENVTYWSASGVPVPVKVVYGDGTVTMELASYT